jgi:hypothetical protein
MGREDGLAGTADVWADFGHEHRAQKMAIWRDSCESAECAHMHRKRHLGHPARATDAEEVIRLPVEPMRVERSYEAWKDFRGLQKRGFKEEEVGRGDESHVRAVSWVNKAHS